MSPIFVHLSDLHVNRLAVGSPYDLDADQRTLLLEDVQGALDPFGPADGVLITGDVAFSGHHDEYAKAAIWLDRLTETIACPKDRVWTVPGNHDVDRSVLASYPTIRARHDQVRQCQIVDISDELREGLTAEEPGILAPLANYATFAARYQCEVTAQHPFWIATLPITDTRSLVLCGMTSPLISNETDDDGANRLALGLFQAIIPYRPKDVVITLSHHPPDWLRDGDDVERYFDARARIQLYGHKHTLRVRHIDNSVRIHAGALHPERNLAWRPRYNIIVMEIAEPNALRVIVHARVWDPTTTTFAADYSQDHATQEFQLELAPVGPDDPGTLASPPMSPTAAEAVVPTRAESPDRLLSNKLGRLSHLNQLVLAKRLGLLAVEDRMLRSFTLRDRLIQRARNAGRLAELWNAASVYDETADSSTNPYVLGGEEIGH